ncbi:MAG: nucleoside phosphorylase [Bacteroidales bacterium]|nr:nucleoside phosphorylase [Bacteroidales bacterium]MDT8372878.1 nucleoside phosphorylase [Bacteroidales bacterium]
MKKSELITNADGSIFHLHLLPDEIADRVIIVGDPGRVETIAQMLDTVRIRKSNREFSTVTGSYRKTDFTVISSGIGTDNIDIVVNELDALANIDLKTGMPKEEPRSLTFVRLGTAGGLQSDLAPGSFIATARAVGFDGLLHFYEGYEWCIDHMLADALAGHLEWPDSLAYPYAVEADTFLLESIAAEITKGITISAPGFYGPQGRHLRLEPFDSEINEKIASFRFRGERITNYEMESSAIYGLGKLLNHKALTICVVIANRVTGEFLTDYKPAVKSLSGKVLEALSS